MRKLWWAGLVLLAPVLVMAKGAPALRGVRLNMPKHKVHRLLEKTAKLRNLEENQELWTLADDAAARSIIVGYTPDDEVRYVTVFAKTKDQRRSLECKPLRNLASAVRTGSPGNYTFIRNWRDGKNEEFTALARGASPDQLTSCSVKKIGAQIEDESEGRRANQPKEKE
jgi:hypothetical protein